MSTTLPAINASSTPTPSLYTSPLPAPALPPSVVTGAQNGSDAVVPEKGTSVFPSSSSEPPAKKPRVRTKKASLSKRSRKNATSAPSPDSASSSTLQSPCTSQSCFADAPERVITFKRRTRRIAVAEASDMLATFLATVSESTDPSDQFACPFCDYVQAKRRKPDLLRHVKSHFQGTDWPCCGVPVEWAEEKLGLSEAVIAAYAAEGRVYEFRGVRMVGGCPIVKVLSRCDALARHLSNSWAKWRKKCKAVRRGEGEPKCYGECGGHEKQQLPCLGNPYGYWLLGNQVKEAAGADVSASEYECEED
ncbi:hypothetical protein C8Q78DRAFT_1060456 [Trametes maxima]|nr:hypothetical protein C8Q78DRAFT_1060456 [Trametes maxima]